MNTGGLITGIILTIVGLTLAIIPFVIKGAIFLLIYGTVALAIGIYMLTHLSEEDNIEGIKKVKKT
jgi:hypothetical protein